MSGICPMEARAIVQSRHPRIPEVHVPRPAKTLANRLEHPTPELLQPKPTPLEILKRRSRQRPRLLPGPGGLLAAPR